MLNAAASAIGERGRSQPGDRTMLDALVPACEALDAASAAREPVPTALAAAAAAARHGAESTRTMTAHVGRAAWLSQRAYGHLDAGAELIARLFASASRHVAAETEDAGRT